MRTCSREYTFTSGAVWSCSDDAPLHIENITKNVKGVKTEDVPEEAYGKFFRLTNTENPIVNYMKENKLEIIRILRGEHKKYTVAGVTVKDNSDIEFSFRDNGVLMTDDKVIMNRAELPCFVIASENDVSFEIKVNPETVGFYTYNFTTIIKTKNGVKYQQLKTGIMNGETIVYKEIYES